MSQFNKAFNLAFNQAFNLSENPPYDTGQVAVDWSNYDGTNDKTPVEFSSDAVVYVKAVPIDSTRALLVYRGTTNYCRARIASISSGGVVSYGTEATILAATVVDVSADLLDSTHAVIAVESGGDVKTIVIEFSGTTISTVGSAVSTETVNSQFLSVCALSSNDFLDNHTNG